MGQFKLAAGEEGGSVLGGWEQSARVSLGSGHYCCVVFPGVGSWTAQDITHLSDNLKCVGRCLDALLEAAQFTTRCVRLAGQEVSHGCQARDAGRGFTWGARSVCQDWCQTGDSLDITFRDRASTVAVRFRTLVNSVAAASRPLLTFRVKRLLFCMGSKAPQYPLSVLAPLDLLIGLVS